MKRHVSANLRRCMHPEDHRTSRKPCSIILTPLTRNSCLLFHQLDPTGNRGDVDRPDETRSVQKTPATSSTIKVSTLVLEEKARASMVSSVVEFILRWESRIEYRVVGSVATCERKAYVWLLWTGRNDSRFMSSLSMPFDMRSS